MYKNSSPEHLSSSRPHTGNLLHRIGSIGMKPDFELSPEEEDVIKTSYRESSPAEIARTDALSARAFEASGLMRPESAVEPELFF